MIQAARLKANPRSGCALPAKAAPTQRQGKRDTSQTWLHIRLLIIMINITTSIVELLLIYLDHTHLTTYNKSFALFL
jgi:hypothetical protein